LSYSVSQVLNRIRLSWKKVLISYFWLTFYWYLTKRNFQFLMWELSITKLRLLMHVSDDCRSWMLKCFGSGSLSHGSGSNQNKNTDPDPKHCSRHTPESPYFRELLEKLFYFWNVRLCWQYLIDQNKIVRMYSFSGRIPDNLFMKMLNSDIRFLKAGYWLFDRVFGIWWPGHLYPVDTEALLLCMRIVIIEYYHLSTLYDKVCVLKISVFMFK